MKRFILAIFFLFPVILQAQNLDLGKELYQNGDYNRAVRIFEQIDTPEGNLFAGKSYFALGSFVKASHYFTKASDQSAEARMKLEADYSEALTRFQLRDYSASLDGFYRIKNRPEASVFVSRSESYYNQLLSYLTLKQVLRVFKETGHDEVRFDLLTSSIGKFDYDKAQTILNVYKQSVVTEQSARLASVERALSDSIAYGQQITPNRYFSAPYGIAYNIGVALPEFDIESEQYEISQHLYFGIQLAIEEFNSENNDKKVFLRFTNTEAENANPENVLNKLIWEQNVDAVIGPLFSETARAFADLSGEYEIPVLTPLANSDALTEEDGYVFQYNPTFKVRGKQMARYAVNNLGLDTLAVLAEQGALGEAAAIGFRNEAEKLGAFIKYFFVEDLASNGYSILEYTQNFSQSDTLMPAAGIKGLYVPFTGAVAPTLISALLTDLEATQSNYVILGSEEWANTDLESRRLPETSIYYSQGFDIDYESSQAENFSSNFRLRFQVEPNEFAFIGYDVAKLLLRVIDQVENPAYIKEGLRNLSGHRGFTTTAIFSGNYVNQNIFIKSVLREDQMEEIESETDN